jgi:small subunit ribosomal protein S9
MAEITSKIGRRKTAVARISMTPGKGQMKINGRTLTDYFPSEILQIVVNQPFALTNTVGSFDITAKIDGGGIKGQAEALRMAISRALQTQDAELRSPLKKEGFLTRDPRMVERKKPGRAKARKRFQFSKR